MKLKLAERIHFTRPTIRLAFSYLVIIMLLNIVFSTVYYITSLNELSTQLAPPTLRNSTEKLPSKIQSFVITTSGITHITSTPHSEQLMLQQRVAQSLTNLRHMLVFLNICALFLSIGLSYYLARRTLRPIEKAMEAQSRFASDASHELRTPLTVMQAEIEGALRTLDLSDQAKAVLISNLEEIAHLKELAEGLLKLTYEAESVLQPEWTDEIVALATNHVTKLALTKDILMHNASPHVQILADKQSLTEAIVILLDNAITYSPQESSIHITGDEEGKYIQLHIRDEGSGIAKEDVPHIFERFYRAGKSRTQHPSGHGLGLSIAQNLIALQHGNITVNSALGKGSTFTIKLPTINTK